METELTAGQLAQQDDVDNAIYALLCNISPTGTLPWDIAAIGSIRDVLFEQVTCLTGINVDSQYPSVEISALEH